MSQITYLSSNELAEIHRKHQEDPINIVLIDVRSETEHLSGHIPNSLHIALDQISQVESDRFKDQTVVFYCRSGMRTRTYANILESLTTKKSYCISGGILEWVSNGLPVQF